MTTIHITYEATEVVDTDDLVITIDDSPVEYVLEDKFIIIDNSPDEFGFHMLKIHHPNISQTQKIKINNFNVNSASVRHTLFLSYAPKNNLRQNTTVISDYHPEWHMPYGNPVSWWLAECARNFKTRTYGKQIDDEYTVWYPETTRIEGNYPQTMKDFFEHNFGFTAVEKSEFKTVFHNMKIPCMRLPNLKYNEDALLKEFTEHIDLFEKSDWVPDQNNYIEDEKDFNLKESASIPWQILRPTLGEEVSDITDVFPESARLQQELLDNGCFIGMTFLACLHGESFVSPHLDDYWTQHPLLAPQRGMTKIWIPIGWEPGNYFKLDRVGNVPIDQGAWLFNPNCFTHASINTTKNPRFTIAFNVEIREPGKFTRYL